MSDANQATDKYLPPRVAPRVCAVVVTYNRPALLRECLLALQDQTRTVDEILVVDNASTDGTRAMLEDEFPQVQVLALRKNGGGAGGFHAGMKRAHEHGFDWVWLMDDDGRPAPDCLQILLEHGKADAVVAPVQREASGRQYGIGTWRGIYADATPALVEKGEAAEGKYLFAFVGPLIHRGVVDRVGLPRAEFFIWFDDYEYALRLHEHPEIAVIAVPRAQFFHELGGTSRTVRLLGRRAVRSDQPAWKTYYGTRNHLWTVLRTRRSARDLGWFLLHQAWLLAGDVVFEKDRRKRVQMRLRGIRDGALGRMGKRV